MRVGWPAATLATVITVLGCTLFPFHFLVTGSGLPSWPQLLVVGVGPDRGWDVLENLVLFLPLGFSLAGSLHEQGIRPSSALAAVLVLCVSCSYLIEVLQQFIPGRFASLTDVAANTVGAVLGCWCHRLWLRRVQTSE